MAMVTRLAAAALCAAAVLSLCGSAAAFADEEGQKETCIFHEEGEEREVICRDKDGKNITFVEKTAELCSEVVEPGTPLFFFYLFGSIFLVCAAGVMSGLTIGLMSFDEKNLEILKIESKDPKVKRDASRVQDLVKEHHLLLVTLLLWNAACFESLPLFLDRLVPSWAAIIISVTGILIFGEIVPQAACTGPKRLAIASKAYYLVLILMIVSFPIAWFFAQVLDKVLGTHEDRASSFMYIEKEKLSIANAQPGEMALIEVHGYTDTISAHTHENKPGGKITSAATRSAQMEEGGAARRASLTGLDGDTDTDMLVN